jgi:UDP-N-acetylglucosamine transferase subunit ALG13
LIFVTVGNHYQGFERLIRKMDEIAGMIDEKVIMQIGYGKYKPKNVEYFDFIESYKEIQELNQKARVVVCHGGAGAIITALEQGTPVIAVPRLKKYAEHTDDQQLDIVTAMAEEGKIIAVYDVDKLEKVLKSIGKKSIEIEKDRRLVNFLKDYLSNLEKSLKEGDHS